MRVTVKYFASIRESIGIAFEQLELPPTELQAFTVGALRRTLIDKGGAYAQALALGKSVRTALNLVMCDEAAVLTDGCEVAFFPPVTGG